MPTAERIKPQRQILTPMMKWVQEKNQGRHPREIICELSADDLSDDEIAEKLGISKHTLKLWISELGIKRRRVLTLSSNSD